MKRILVISLVLLMPLLILAQQDNYPVVGVSDTRPGTWFLKGAKVVVDHTTTLENADIIIKDGRIIEVGKGLKAPSGARIADLTGKTVYPSFIDIYSSYGIQRETRPAQTQQTAGIDPSILSLIGGFAGRQTGTTPRARVADYWNEGIKESYDAASGFMPDDRSAGEYRQAGFGAVVTHREDGIARGTSALVTLANDRTNKIILADRVSTHFSMVRGTSQDAYPTSQFGSIALLRQFYYDAGWYKSIADGVFFDAALEAEKRNRNLPKVFEVRNRYEIIRAHNIGKEFGFRYIVKGNGDEYQTIEEIKKTGVSLIIPLNFPEAPDVKDSYIANSVRVDQLKHWELAPYNPGIVAGEGIEFAITTSDLRRKSDFLKNLRKAVASGLDKTAALSAVTSVPAKMTGTDKLLGAIKPGMVANLLVTSGDIFDESCIIYDNWIQGSRHVITPQNIVQVAGIYDLKAGGKEYTLEIEQTSTRLTARVKTGDTVLKTEATLSGSLLAISFTENKSNVRLSGHAEEKVLKGTGQAADGSWIEWQADFREPVSRKERPQSMATEAGEPGIITYPFLAYGWHQRPVQEDILIRNATVWTLENEGIIEGGDVLVRNGKIAAVGKNLNASGVRIIDGTGMHLTPGIIDEHSHIATNATNETGFAITSEVRIGDVIDPANRNIYQQLAGGVTTSHLLHGSANPIGGQSAIIKLRWGFSAEEMLVKNQTQFLKHALGENVKRSTTRFPNSRMGTEQIIRDAYLRAGEYAAEWKKYNSLPAREQAKAIPPRRDLQMDALVEVLEGRSFMACHTYVQSEANMIMRLADELGFRAHTLIHMNEGYKVADLMAAHGAAGSVFSDWWAYKNEVWEGIPYNAPILLSQGVLTCLHSDDAEMARRLNQEAGKMVKYGNISQEEALKLVTLNPAKILHLDDRIGSIRVGKDADLVLWTDNPLSIYARADKTMIDGIVFYDEEKDREMKGWTDNERNRIIQKILSQSKQQSPTGGAPAVQGRGEELNY
ncbi:MAG: amidohydrolase family protein [Bacteroidales bacterium]